MIQHDGPPRGALSDRVAVVVGGASGIGKTVAKAFARQGARVVIADFDTARMDRTVDEILHLGTTDAALALATDVRNDASVRALAGDAARAMGPVDVLVNMAGVFLQGRLDRLKGGDWKWMLDTNLLGPVRTTAAFLPAMVARGSGHVINAVGIGGLLPADPLTIAYDTGQAALAAFTRSLAANERGSGVHVSLYCAASRAPRIGQNTRSRGMGRLLRRTEEPEEWGASDALADALIDAVHHPRFLIVADAADAAAASAWDDVAAPHPPEALATAR